MSANILVRKTTRRAKSMAQDFDRVGGEMEDLHKSCMLNRSCPNLVLPDHFCEFLLIKVNNKFAAASGKWP